MTLPESLEFLMPNDVKWFFNSTWKLLDDIDLIPHDFPGNYLIAWTKEDLIGSVVKPEHIFYNGMSNAADGVKSRLNFFRSAAYYGKAPHSGGKRFFTKYCKGVPYHQFKHPNKFYLTYRMQDCQVVKDKRTPKDLLIMGKVCLLEMELMAYIKYHTGKEPELNKK